MPSDALQISGVFLLVNTTSCISFSGPILITFHQLPQTNIV
jgi:hypothetical protein